MQKEKKSLKRKKKNLICVGRNFKQHYFTNQKLHYSVFLWGKKKMA